MRKYDSISEQLLLSVVYIELYHLTKVSERQIIWQQEF